MKQVLFATSNPSKVKRFKEGLAKVGIEVLSLKDLNIDLEVEENGNCAIENALSKARTIYAKTHMPTIGMDDTLYLENVKEEKQPGLYVRRINGKTLNDDEMLDYYTSLVRDYGTNGRLNAKGEESTYTWFKDNFYMVDTVSDTINKGYPLNSISKYKKIDKYFTDVTEEEKMLIKVNEDDVVEFIENHI